jgi:site-specific DNA-cytosine methylase
VLAKRRRSADSATPADSLPSPTGSAPPKKKSRRTAQRPAEEPILAECLLQPSGSSCSGVALVDKGFTMGSICSGIGTCHKAMAVLRRFNPSLRVQHIFACEKDSRCRAHLEKLVEYHPGCVLYRNIMLDEDTLPKVDFLVSGFPCQPFSQANRKRRGDQDPRGQIFIKIIEYIERARPQAIVFENVPGLQSFARPMLSEAVGRLRALGYSVAGRKLNSLHYGGVPQSRLRLYIVAWLPAVESGGLMWPQPVPRPSLASVLGDEHGERDKLPSAPQARAKVLGAEARLSHLKLTEIERDGVVVNCNAISGAVTIGHTPCLTATRAGSGGFWLLGRHRFMTLSEMLRLQAMDPTTDLQTSTAQAGKMIGNAFTQSVIARVMATALRASGLCSSVVDPYERLATDP